MKKICTLVLIVTAFIARPALAQNTKGYNIDVKIKGLKDSTAYLAYYYGDKKFAQDTAKIDSKGHFVFKGEEKLLGGIFMIVLPGQQYFEIIPDNPDIKIESDTAHLVRNLKVTGSQETALFYDYLKFVDENARKIQELSAKNEAASPEEQTKIAEQIKELEKKILDYKKDVIAKYPESFVTKVFLAMREPEIPETPVGQDSSWQYYYFKNHYFDNFDFTDDRLVRTPVYQPRIEKYITKLTMQHPDSIIEAADYILEKTKNSPEQFKFNLYWLTNYYERSKLMIAENVFAHLAVKYWCDDEYDKSWMDSVTVFKICQKGQKEWPTLVGKEAPELNLEDTLGKKHSLHKVDAKYTVLYFWDSTCGHCKKQTPKLIEVYKKYQDEGLEVYSVNTEWESKSYKQYLREHDMDDFTNVQDTTNASRFRQIYDITATPVVIMLDENKEIIAKRIDVETIGEILENRKKKVN